MPDQQTQLTSASLPVLDPNYENAIGRIGRRARVITLGGCSTLESGRHLHSGRFQLVTHLWRRPTIALVSKPVDRVDSRVSKFPSQFLPYFISDAKKLHLPDLLSADAEVLLFDITRDVVTGVVDIGSGNYVMDPLEGVGILDNLTRENMNEEIFSAAFGNCERVAWHRDWMRFFQLWKNGFTVLVELLLKKFKHVILLEHYYTSKINGVPYDFTFNVAHQQTVNAKLEMMYDFAREFSGISVVSLPKSLYITGREVAWTGPFYTHYISEVYALYAEKIDRLLFPEASDSGEAILNMLFLRSAQRDQAKAERDTLSTQRDQLTNEKAAAIAERDRLAAELAAKTAERDQAVKEKAAVIAERDRLAADLAAKTAERDEAVKEKAAAIAERDRAAAESQTFADYLAADLAAKTAERDQAVKEKAAAIAERDRLAAELAAKTAERNQAAAA